MPAEFHRLPDLLEAGRLARTTLPRSAHGDYVASPRDPVATIEQQHATRPVHLIPLRAARMAQSSFAFLHGTEGIMAFDLQRQPATGELVVASGDAHVANFGLSATPERHLTFELDDFDEVSTAPWKGDIKRLYLGTGTRSPGAIAGWALDYSAQVEQDFAVLQETITTGRLPTTRLV